MSCGEKQLDVIIIGAGLSGLMAGLILKKSGKRFTILEAQSRVGGRILSTSYQGNTIDLGAQWVSPYQTRISKLMKEYGLITTKTYMEGTSTFALHQKKMRGMGESLPYSLFSKLDVWNIERLLKNYLIDLIPEKPWKSPNANKLDQVTMEAWLQKIMFSRYGKGFFRVLTEEGICNDLSEVSLLDVLWEIKTSGGYEHFLTSENEWITNGAQALPNRMATELGNTVRLEEKVIRIDWKESIVHIDTVKGAWSCKKVILAMPPTFTARILYEPGLPAARDQLCQRIWQGSVMKCILVYKQPFWRKKGESGITYYDEGPVKATIDSSTPGSLEGVLTAFVTGNHALRLGQLDENSRKKQVLQCLNYLLGPEALHPIVYFEKDWSSDPWARGGYGGHFPPGTLTQIGESLSKPIGPIHFAGSETATEWRLYMEGALEAGERAAFEVLQSLNQE